MNIHMAGIDYSKAPVIVRERFALPPGAAAQAMCSIQKSARVNGCVLLSTCNRTELWLSGGEVSPVVVLCEALGLNTKDFTQFFIERTGRQAIDHLMELACGMRSQIFGEDQILAQVKNAIAAAREQGCADVVLEELFRAAVTAAKQVKTQVRLTAPGQSVARRTADFLAQKLGTLAGVPCLVIGNGEIGRLTADALRERGAFVQMTVRSRPGGQEICMPPGVHAVAYSDRMKALSSVQVVVSATASPHYTLRAREIGSLPHPIVFCDLAMPRDIDPEVERLAGASLYDADEICSGEFTRADPESMERAIKILAEHADELEERLAFRGMVPLVEQISGLAAQDARGRVERTIRSLQIPDSERQQLAEHVELAAQKAVGRLIFGLRENLPPALWQSCIEGLRKSARREKIS